MNASLAMRLCCQTDWKHAAVNDHVGKNTEIQTLMEACSKPHDIVIYTDGSITRDQNGPGFSVRQGRLQTKKVNGVSAPRQTNDWGAFRPAVHWLASRSHRYHSHDASAQTLLTCCEEIESGTSLYAVTERFRLQRLMWIYFAVPESKEKNRQIDRKIGQTLLLACILAWQRR